VLIYKQNTETGSMLLRELTLKLPSKSVTQ